MKRHEYGVEVLWSDPSGTGTRSYSSYRRDYVVSAGGKPVIPSSSDPSFRGDPGRYNPEELLLASLSGCHMLWYLHLCAVNGVCVLDYRDDAHGVVQEDGEGGGEFTAVTLRPKVQVAAGSDRQRALALHEQAHRLCFIARSVKFPVHCEPQVTG